MKLPIRKHRPIVFMPWLFDDEQAWINTIKDERVHYKMNIYEFMSIYQYYRKANQS